ncbi:MAG: competence/damage-inducible protein A [Desulfovibrio sp.]|nr:competence/damage-inducible protein A [Desulfovibrio sp.]
MKAEIVSIGTELLLGHAVNTDAAFLARELAQLGIDLEHVATVGDNPGRLKACLLEALSRSDLVISSGGLGPTLDDLTKKTAAEVLGVDLALDEGSLADLKEYFKGRHMGENQLLQAWLPKGSTPLKNTVGTAPGCLAETASGKLLALLPGPPRELEPMFRDQLAPLLARRTGCAIVSHMVRTFNQSEGDAALKLGALCSQANPSVATYIDELNQTYVRVTAKAESREAAEALAAPVVEQVKDVLGDVVWGVDGDSLEQTVVRLLAARGEEVATAESCTGGLVAKRLTDCAGSSEVFRTGLVTYANEAKTRLLGVPEDLLARVGAVSEEVARTMAEEARKRAEAAYGIGITGIAGPGGGTPQKPVGLVWIALACPEETYVRKLPPFGGRYPGRDALRQRSAGMALDMLRRRLQGRPVVA